MFLIVLLLSAWFAFSICYACALAWAAAASDFRLQTSDFRLILPSGLRGIPPAPRWVPDGAQKDVGWFLLSTTPRPLLRLNPRLFS